VKTVYYRCQVIKWSNLIIFLQASNIYILSKKYTRIYYLSLTLLLLGTDAILPLAREITHTKRIILESNRECGKGYTGTIIFKTKSIQFNIK
jgi:hypothetical protein